MLLAKKPALFSKRSFLTLPHEYGGFKPMSTYGRLYDNKTLLVATVETNARDHPTHTKISGVKFFRKTKVATWCRCYLVTDNIITLDGLVCIKTVTDKNCLHKHTQ